MDEVDKATTVDQGERDRTGRRRRQRSPYGSGGESKMRTNQKADFHFLRRPREKR